MSTYDLWKTSVQLAEDATTNFEQAHHYAIAGVLRHDAIKDYFGHIAGELYDPTEEVVDTPDDDQVSEFLRDLDALRETDKLTDRALTEALDALKAMELLNYTGDHTHFEVLADARQVLSAVMLGKPMPSLERFRCPSKYRRSSGEIVQCVLQLPHEGNHNEGKPDSAGVNRTSWSDEASLIPPKSYDLPADPCPILYCTLTANHNGTCRDAQGELA